MESSIPSPNAIFAVVESECALMLLILIDLNWGAYKLLNKNQSLFSDTNIIDLL